MDLRRVRLCSAKLLSILGRQKPDVAAPLCGHAQKGTYELGFVLSLLNIGTKPNPPGTCSSQ